MNERPQAPAPLIIRRSSIGLFFGIIGSAALLLSAGLFVWYLRVNSVVLITLGIGVVGFVAWAIISPQSFVGVLSGRQAQRSTTAIFSTLLLLSVVTLSYSVIKRENVGLDVTAGRVFTLSQTSLDVIDRIPNGQQMQIIGFYSPQGVVSQAIDDQFLRQYALQSDGKIRIEYIDPIQQPGIAARFGYFEDGNLFAMFLDANGNPIESTIAFIPRQGRQERDITTTINRMLNSGFFTVYFDTTRGSLDILEETSQGLTLVDNSLRLSGIRTAQIDIFELASNNQPIPIDTAVLVLARPLVDLFENEVALIADYLERGGSLLILADVTFNESFFLAEGQPFSEYLRTRYGIRALDAAAVDFGASLQTPLDLIGFAVFTEHPIGAALPDEQIYFRLARVLEASADKPETVANGRLISTSPQSHAERDLRALADTNTYIFDEATDQIGPVDLAVWAQDLENDSRVVIIGDSDFITNSVVETASTANEALFLQSVLWLSGTSDNISFGFTANPSQVPTIFMSARQLDIIGILTIGIMPLVVLGLGIFVWYRRTYA